MMYEPLNRRAPIGSRSRRPRASWAALAFLAGGLTGVPAQAQQPPAPSTPEVVPAYAQSIISGTDTNITQAGCASCGGGLAPPAAMPMGGGWTGGAPCACTDDSCASCLCKPGKKDICKCLGDGCSDSFLGRFTSGMIQCTCCPDPCYEGSWNYVANSAFFRDTVRPQTYSRFRWDSGRDLFQPERAEYFWAKPGALGGRGPQNVERRVDYDELLAYSEIASGNFAFFIETTYRGVEPANNAAHSNFGDLNLGTKTLMVDCELYQLSFQFRTYIPTGNARNGIGTGHTSLEPSILTSIKLNHDTYLQSQVAYWIPVGGDRDFQGATWHYGTSINHEWCRKGTMQVISTAEVDAYTFTDGAIVNRDLIAAGVAANAGNARRLTQRGSNESYVSAGGGLRLVFCDKFDIGFGTAFGMTGDHFADYLYRTELRWKY